MRNPRERSTSSNPCYGLPRPSRLAHGELFHADRGYPFRGSLGAVALGGVALGSGLFAIIMMIAIGILLGLDYRVSRAYGAKNTTSALAF